MVGIGRKGVDPFAVGYVVVYWAPFASVTRACGTYVLEKFNHDASRRKLVPASANPAGLYQIAPRSSAPATNAPPRPSGRTPRSEK